MQALKWTYKIMYFIFHFEVIPSSFLMDIYLTSLRNLKWRRFHRFPSSLLLYNYQFGQKAFLKIQDLTAV